MKCIGCQTSVVAGAGFCGVCGRLATSEETENVALFEDMAREMASNPWPGWKTELAERGAELGITQATFNRVLADRDRASAQRAAISLEVDKSAIESFFVDHICQLRLRLVNEGGRGLKALRLRWATTSCNGVKDEHSRPVGPNHDVILTASIQPKTPGQHVLEGVITATDYGLIESHFSFHAITFQVAEKTDGPQTVINQTTVDFGDVRATDQSGMSIGGGSAALQASGRLLVGGDWVVIVLSPMSEGQATAWERRNQIDSVPEQTVAPDPTSSAPSVIDEPSVAPAPHAEEERTGSRDLPDGKYHYAGPSGRSLLSADEVRYKVREEPDANHKVWKDGWAQWKAWSQIPELANATPWRRTATAPTMSPAPADAPSATAPRQQGDIEVELVDAGLARSKLIRVLCESGELSIGDAAKALNSPPFGFAHVESQDEAQALIARCAAVGAQAQVKGGAGATTRASSAVSVPTGSVQPRDCPSCGRTNLGDAPFCMFCSSAMRSRAGRPTRRSASTGQSSTFGVQLSETGTRMIQLMAVVGEVTGKGMAETRQMLSSLPCVLSSGLSEADAKRLAAKVSQAGGAAEVVQA